MAVNRPGPSRAPSGDEREHGPSIYLAVERTPVMRLSRTLDNRSWVPGMYGAIYRANLRIAREVQRVAVELLAQRIVRPSQKTGRLERAVADPRAVYADALRIVIGVAEWLDAQASYWRPVEMGAPNLRGRVVYGFWTRASRLDRGRLTDLHGPIRGEITGRPIVLSWDEPPGRRFAFAFTIENPTQAHYFFLDAWNRVGESGFMERVYREEFAQVTGPGGGPISLPDTFQAYHGRPLTDADFRL